MPDQLPDVCVPIQDDINNMKSDLAELQQELRSDPDINKQLLLNGIAKLNAQIAQAEDQLATCIASNPITPPPPVPAECNYIKVGIDNMKSDLAELQQELKIDPDINKELILKGIADLNVQISRAEDAYAYCIANPPIAAPQTTMPSAINTDESLQNVEKIIPWSFLQQKMNEFLNQRMDPAILSIRVDHHVHFNSNGDLDDQPATDITISKIEAAVVDGKVTTEYKPIKSLDLGQLPAGYYISDFNVSSINVAIDPTQPEPIKVTVSFECGGPGEINSTTFGVPNFDLVQFDVSLKLTLDALRTPKAIPAQCADIQSNINNMKSDLAELQQELKSDQDINRELILKGIADLNVQISKAQDDLQACVIQFGGADPTATGRLEFLSWIDKISNLQDDAFDNALKNYVVAHVQTTGFLDPDGTFQKAIRNAIYGRLKDPALRSTISSMISNWILGGTGNYDVVSVVNDGQNLTIEYLVPEKKLDPFPDSMFRPAGWPYLGNRKPTIKLPLLKRLKDIEHIVVLTMENRSFDQMLGYLSLPVSAGGMGRNEIDGLNQSGTQVNHFEGANYFPFAFDAGDTAFPLDPSHSYEPVFRQINADPAVPGSGKMDGFVKSLAIDKLAGGFAPRIMGYHTAVNVPVYDVLVRDFAISHRWFASHPGPTFCNRFYELTGRLNLASGLNQDTPPLKEDFWEFSNSSPLTPVFNKTIFDHLTQYSNTIDNTVSWKYYEHGYCFLRFFSKYTFNNTNIFSIDDPLNGFFADAKNGTLPSVAYIDPHFIELPPHANCDGPVADVKDGQDLVQRVVEAVVTSPKFENTLLIITYDEHGGFYDHVPPPPAPAFDDAFPIKTYGVRVPAFFISPRVDAQAVFGHDKDANGKTLYFDHTSILKTIATRFMSKNPPYMGPRYAAANDLTGILRTRARKLQFLPFVRYNLSYYASEMRMNVEGGNPTPGPIVARFDLNETDQQRFSFEQRGNYVYIRTHCGSLYVTVDVPNGNTSVPPPQGFGIKQDVKYDGGLALTDPKKFNAKYQRWKFTPLGTNEADKNLYIVTNEYFPNKILQPLDLKQNATPLVLVNKPKTLTAMNAWMVSGPLTSV